MNGPVGRGALRRELRHASPFENKNITYTRKNNGTLFFVGKKYPCCGWGQLSEEKLKLMRATRSSYGVPVSSFDLQKARRIALKKANRVSACRGCKTAKAACNKFRPCIRCTRFDQDCNDFHPLVSITFDCP